LFANHRQHRPPHTLKKTSQRVEKARQHLAAPLNQEEFLLMAEPAPVFRHAFKLSPGDPKIPQPRPRFQKREGLHTTFDVAWIPLQVFSLNAQ